MTLAGSVYCLDVALSGNRQSQRTLNLILGMMPPPVLVQHSRVRCSCIRPLHTFLHKRTYQHTPTYTHTHFIYPTRYILCVHFARVGDRVEPTAAAAKSEISPHNNINISHVPRPLFLASLFRRGYVSATDWCPQSRPWNPAPPLLNLALGLICPPLRSS